MIGMIAAKWTPAGRWSPCGEYCYALMDYGQAKYGQDRLIYGPKPRIMPESADDALKRLWGSWYAIQRL